VNTKAADNRVTIEYPNDSKDIAIIMINNPPVNAISIGVPDAILDCIQSLEAADETLSILIVGAGKGIFGGADIKVQGKPWPEGKANLIDLISELEQVKKPVGILLQSAAVGGGLEIAMACRYRIALSGTKLGQPEITLGIPPGAGGTQRLPRLVGVDKALDMILSGKPILAEEALETGLVDCIVSINAPLEESVKFMLEQNLKSDMNPRTSERDIVIQNPLIFDGARDRVAKRFKGQMSPLACIDCVEAATTMPFEQGLAYERQRYLECVTSEEAKSMRHIFFAERASKKIPGIAKDIKLRKIEKAAVVGAGTMGVGIAMCFARSEIPVTLVEIDMKSLSRGLNRIHEMIDSQAKKGRISAGEAKKQKELISSAVGLQSVADADIVVEAVFEDMGVKNSVFSELSRHTRPETILATNTSYLNVDEIASSTGGREENVIGLHFFSPANIMKLLEVVRGYKTDDDVLATGLSLGARLGKIPVVSGVGHGFIGNRMFSQYNREAEFLLQDGSTCQQIDNALKNFGMAMGSFEVRDMAGLDIGWAMRKSTAHQRNPEQRYSRVGDILCEQGWFGQKTKKGFYLYDDGKAHPNPDLQAIIDQSSAETSLNPGIVSDEAIIERCIYALINEGAKILDEGIAIRASDIDLVFVNGYGFPRWRGGPMHWADHVGLPLILGKIEEFNKVHDFWQPSSLLQSLVEQGKTFKQWDAEGRV
jgi:3-hydroxyacyl-CoA dehydrogenase